jgi:hypothetical protein
MEPITAPQQDTSIVARGKSLGRLQQLQHLPKDAEVLAFEAGCEEYCEREVDEVELQGGRIYLHLGVRRDDRRQR